MSSETEILLCYVSSAGWLWEKDELLTLLEKSRKNNSDRGITGALLYRGGTFLQFLEGPAAEVETVFDRISQDPRHHGIIPLLRKSVSERVFKDWSMGFRELGVEEARDLEDVTNESGDASAIVERLIASFRSVNR